MVEGTDISRSRSKAVALLAAFGRFGDAPFEFQRIRAVAEASSGRIVVAGSRSSHLTYLTRALAPDTMVALPAAAMDILALGSDLLVRMNTGDPLDGAGETVGTFGTPSPSFRPIDVLELGMLADLGSYGTTLPGLLASSVATGRQS